VRVRFRLFVIRAAPTLALLGGMVFAIGLLVELLSGRVIGAALSPAVQIALAGLCMAAVMFFVWFSVVGLLLLRQSRAMGSGYGEAYRLIESFHFREAIPLLERSIEEGKENADVLMLLTSAYAYAGQLGKAQATADRAVRLYPDNSGSYITLANGYRIQAAYEEAARALVKATELDPNQPIVWAELGFTEHFSGHHEAALQAFERAAQVVMPAMYGVRVFYHLAQAYAAAGKTQQAVSATARMMSARDGLAIWESGLNALEGTAYGQALRHEIDAIRQSLADADSATIA
jgi:tetratricopeptide (TPR) repeat protein